MNSDRTRCRRKAGTRHGQRIRAAGRAEPECAISRCGDMCTEFDDFNGSESDRLSRLIGDAHFQRVGKCERDEQRDDVHGRELSYRLAAMNWLGDWANLL